MTYTTERFVKIPVTLIRCQEIKHVDVRVYGEIRSHCHEKTKRPAFPSRRTIANKIGCSVDTVDRSLKRLVSTGLIFRKTGFRGRANQYHFLSGREPELDMRPSGGKSANELAATVSPQSEIENQSYKSELRNRLYHGKDLASVMCDGSIRIKTHSGQWVDYSGNDDEAFRFGVLRGSAARRAALKRFQTNS